MDRMSRLETEVEGLRVREDIRALKARYWRMLDQFMEDAVEGLFSAHAVLDFMDYGSIEGRPAIVDFFTSDVLEAYDMMIHHGSNSEIERTSSHSATGIWQYEAWTLAKGTGIGYWHAGWYEDRYIIEDDVWKIEYSKGQHHFNSRVTDQWAKHRFENDEWPPRAR